MGFWPLITDSIVVSYISGVVDEVRLVVGAWNGSVLCGGGLFEIVQKGNATKTTCEWLILNYCGEIMKRERFFFHQHYVYL